MIEPQFVMKFQSACMRSSYMITQVGLKWLVWSDGWNIFGAQFVVAWVEEQPSSQSCPYDNKCLPRISQFWGLSFRLWIWKLGKCISLCPPNMYTVHTLSRVIRDPNLEYTSMWLQLCVKNDCRVWAGLTNASMPLILSHWLFLYWSKWWRQCAKYIKNNKTHGEAWNRINYASNNYVMLNYREKDALQISPSFGSFNDGMLWVWRMGLVHEEIQAIQSKLLHVKKCWW